MKRGLLLWIYVLAFALILSFFISSFNKHGNNPLASPTDCDANQVILSLFSSTNSHVSAYNDAAFPYKVCYSDIFGSNYAGNTYMHACQELKPEPAGEVYVFSNSITSITDKVPLYRLYAEDPTITSPSPDDRTSHFYTTDAAERDIYNLNYGWKLETGDNNNIIHAYLFRDSGTD